MIDDSVLLGRWRAGDARAGDMLVRSHDPSLAAYLRGKTSAQEYEDLKQQVWLELARSRPMAVEISVRAYLFGIARHMLFRHCDRRRRRPAWDSLTTTLVDLATYLAWARREPQAGVDLWTRLERLPGDVRRLLEARYIHELSTVQLAARYDVPTGTIKSRLSHARKLLRAAMPRDSAPYRSHARAGRTGPDLLLAPTARARTPLKRRPSSTPTDREPEVRCVEPRAGVRCGGHPDSRA